jgi:hypothetical protein
MYDANYEEGVKMDKTMHSDNNVHEDMIKIVNVFNSLPSKEKQIIMAML